MDEEVESILRSAGIESWPIDPSSMDALVELVRERRENNAAPNAARASSSPKPRRVPTSEQDEILRLLHMHTAMMIETQRKLDAMAAKVDFLERNLQGATSITPPTRTNAERAVTQQQNADAAQPQPNDARPMFQPLKVILDAVSTLTLVRVIRLFWTRSEGFVRPLDGGLMFKLIFMIVVLTARMSRSPAAASSSRFYISVSVMVLGFLYHTKYLQFFYQFVWKDNIPIRVWAGEDLENVANDNTGNELNRGGHDPQPGLGPRPPRQNNNNNQEPHPDDQREALPQNFFAGAIHPRDQQQNVVVAMLQDVIYLCGSFFLSIFPIWHPVDQRRRTPEPHADEDPGAMGGPQRGINDQGLPAIPQVAPPHDAMTPAEDDERTSSHGADDESTSGEG